MTTPLNSMDETVMSSVAESVADLMSMFYQVTISNAPFTKEQRNTMTQLLLNAEPSDSVSLFAVPSLLSSNNHKFVVVVKEQPVHQKEYPYEHLALFEKTQIEQWSNDTINNWFQTVRENEYYRFHSSELTVEKINSRRFKIRLINNSNADGLRFAFNVGF